MIVGILPDRGSEEKFMSTQLWRIGKFKTLEDREEFIETAERLGAKVDGIEVERYGGDRGIKFRVPAKIKQSFFDLIYGRVGHVTPGLRLDDDGNVVQLDDDGNVV